MSANASANTTAEHEMLQRQLSAIGQRARVAAAAISAAEPGAKNAALYALADLLQSQQHKLLEENAKDMQAGRERGLDAALLDRLELTPERIVSMAEGVRQIANLNDPVGEIDQWSYRPSGIQVGKMRVPLGVVGIIYESRPNVTADAAALCLKAGNATILRGGSEAIRSNLAIGACVAQALRDAELPADCVQVLDMTDRAAVPIMAQMAEYIDVIVPRGGKGLVAAVADSARVPVIKHLHGVCHVYIDDAADAEKARAIAVNAKTQRYGTCNTMETLLVAASRAAELLPALAADYRQAGVELRGCERTLDIVSDAVAASEQDWAEEYLAPVLAVKVVDDIEAAMAHIRKYGSNHTESIVTENLATARRFLREVDSSSVMVNASTRFADGFEYGLGAEIGISTDKLHARGPVGLEGLTTEKYVVMGDGHIR